MLNPFWGQRWWEMVRDKTPLGCSCERKLVTGWILRLWCLISSVTSKTCPHWWRANQVSTFACLGTEETHMDKQRLKRQQLQVAGFLVFLGQRSHTDLHRSPCVSLHCHIWAEAGQAIEFFTEAEVGMDLWSSQRHPYGSPNKEHSEMLCFHGKNV